MSDLNPFANILDRKESVSDLDEEIGRLTLQVSKDLEKYEKLLRSYKIKQFVPSPKQWEFIKMAHIPRRAVIAGNRFGKSTVGIVEDICFMLGHRPYLSPTHPLYTWGIPDHGVKILVIAQDWDKVKEIFTNDTEDSERVGKLFEWLPRDCIAPDGLGKTSTGVINQVDIQVTFRGRVRRSSIHFDTVRSYKADKMGQESSDWDVIHVDEPIPQGMWNAVSRGLIDREGKAWMLLTPLSENWLTSWFEEQASADPKNFFHMSATMHDNPTLTEQAKQLYLSQLSDEERTCRELGIPLSAGRKVYWSYSEAVHLVKEDGLVEWAKKVGWESPFFPPDDWNVGASLDLHPTTPHAALFAAWNKDYVVFYHDIFQKVTIRDIVNEVTGEVEVKGLASQIKAAVAGLDVKFIVCDPIAWIKNPETGICWANYLQEAGINVQKASKAKTNGIQEMNEWFSGAKGKQVFVLPWCKHFRREIREYYIGDNGKPVDANDHIMECMYRLGVRDGFTFRPRLPLEEGAGESVNNLDNFNTEFNHENENLNLEFSFNSIPHSL